MKENLNWKSKEVVNIYDEISLWSAPFGRLLLENIPMTQGASILDIGFGTGFPLIELSQRFGEQSKIYGIDIWEEAIIRTKNKIKTLGLNNITILEESATKINIQDHQIDLITSNLGINNFEDKEQVYFEIQRILKPKGKLCITTNPIGTFDELFQLFITIFEEMNLNEELQKIKTYIQHRATKESIEEEFKQVGLTLVNSKVDQTNMRFTDAKALLNHSLIRIGFRSYWENMVQKEKQEVFFKNLIHKINTIIKAQGEFKITIPMLYLEFQKM